MNLKRITKKQWNKTLWIVVFLIWTMVGIKWVSHNIDATTGERIQHELE